MYHAQCNDGKTAAAVVHSYFRSKDHEIIMQAVKYSEPLPDIDEGVYHRIFVVDFSFHGADLTLLATKSNHVTMMDHHGKAIDALKLMSDEGTIPESVELVLDIDRSGAMLAWDYLYKTPYHPIVEDVGRRDLWRKGWQQDFPNAKAVHLALQATPIGEISLALYSDFTLNKVNVNSAFYVKFIQQGKAVLSYVDKMISDHVARGSVIKLSKGNVFAVNCPGHIISELAESIKDKHDTIMCYAIDKNDEVNLSFRSADHSARDHAEAFGGGGHTNAAGATITKQRLWDILND